MQSASRKSLLWDGAPRKIDRPFLQTMVDRYSSDDDRAHLTSTFHLILRTWGHHIKQPRYFPYIQRRSAE